MRKSAKIQNTFVENVYTCMERRQNELETVGVDYFLYLEVLKCSEKFSLLYRVCIAVHRNKKV